jgi:hypothetical protein
LEGGEGKEKKHEGKKKDHGEKEGMRIEVLRISFSCEQNERLM